MEDRKIVDGLVSIIMLSWKMKDLLQKLLSLN